jgi:hypothetical protein
LIDPEIKKVGGGIKGNYTRLRKEFNVSSRTEALLDLYDVCQRRGITDPKLAKQKTNSKLDNYAQLAFKMS